MIAAAVGCFLPGSTTPGPWIAFLDVGQGDAAVMHLSDATTWVIDIGDDRGPGDAARNAVLPFLREQRIRRVKGLVISHRHRDHAGALASFLEGMRVEEVYDGGYGSSRGTSGVVDSTLAAHRLWPCLIARGDTLHAGDDLTLVAVHPARGNPVDPPPGNNLNEASVVIRLDDRGLTVLLAGDAEHLAETACLDQEEPLRARLLKVGHHGSSTSSSVSFLEAVQPEWGIISCGVHNRFGHPAPVTLTRLGQRGVRIARTDRDGTVMFFLGDDGLRVKRHPPIRTQDPRRTSNRDGRCPEG
jgi:competence protein ComEC